MLLTEQQRARAKTELWQANTRREIARLTEEGECQCPDCVAAREPWCEGFPMFTVYGGGMFINGIVR